MKKVGVLYGILSGVLLLLAWWIIQKGSRLEIGIAPFSAAPEPSKQSSWHFLREGMQDPLSIFLLQVLVILSFARLLGWLMGKLGQPSVVGEIVAGILLGPSLLGWLAPDFFLFLFAPASLGNLNLISQLGLVLFMFIVGMELDLRLLRRSALDVVLISQSSIVLPYVLGIVLAWFLYQNYAPAGVGFMPFALFIGIAMSITAFPVLARIAQERGLTKTPLGNLALSAAAINDAMAWCILAALIALVRSGPAHSVLLSIGLAVVYVLFMFYLVKPLLERLAQRFFTYETMNRSVLAVLFALLLLSAFLTQIIGIHALFGAFVVGAIIPPNEDFRHVLINKMEDLTVILLLPLFFVFTGLRTQIGLLNSVELWQVCGLIILLAVLGKFIGSVVPARLMGQSWHDALALGALMNARGLMELVVLNIGFDLGILSPEMFAMMVLMALATTFMTGPVLNTLGWVQRRLQQKKQPNVAPTAAPSVASRLLISFGQPHVGARLLQLAQQLRLPGAIHALHLTPNADISISEAKIFEKEGFKPIQEVATQAQVQLHTHYRASNNVPQEIIQYANREQYDLMLIGSSRSLFSRDETGGMVQTFFEEIKSTVGVLIDKGFGSIQKILMLYQSEQDTFLLKTLRHFSEHSGVQALQIVSLQSSLVIPAFATHLNWVANAEVKTIEFAEYDLLVLSRSQWEYLREQALEWPSPGPSILILQEKMKIASASKP
jgi:Kef-type K+ transport system membrane component KefB